MRRAACLVPMRASSWTLAVSQGGFLRCASSAANLTPSLRMGCGSSSIVRVGAHRPLNRASMNLAPTALRRPAGAGAPSRQARRLPGLPAVVRRRLQPIPPPFPGRGASRPLPSAVHATSSTCTAHGDGRTARPRVKAKPFGWPAASLDSVAALTQCILFTTRTSAFPGTPPTHRACSPDEQALLRTPGSLSP